MAPTEEIVPLGYWVPLVRETVAPGLDDVLEVQTARAAARHARAGRSCGGGLTCVIRDFEHDLSRLVHLHQLVEKAQQSVVRTIGRGKRW